MRIYQYRNGCFTGKIHVVVGFGFLCGARFNSYIDTQDVNKINFSKGICKRCQRIYEIRHREYKPDLNFEFVKLKLGIKI